MYKNVVTFYKLKKNLNVNTMYKKNFNFVNSIATPSNTL